MGSVSAENIKELGSQLYAVCPSDSSFCSFELDTATRGRAEQGLRQIIETCPEKAQEARQVLEQGLAAQKQYEAQQRAAGCLVAMAEAGVVALAGICVAAYYAYQAIAPYFGR